MYEPFNVSGIMTRLRLDIEHLFLANNHLLYIGKAWPTAAWLSLQAGNRLHCCINDLSGIITELSKLPPVAQVWDFGAVSLSEHGPVRGKSASEDFDLVRHLTIPELMEMSNIEYTKECLIESWKFTDDRKKEILDLARQRKRAKE